jgi:N-acetylmuramoyl-L-alanine amidase
MVNRILIRLFTFVLLSLCYFNASADTFIAARVWPAQEYTRIAFESKTPVKYQLLMLDNPDRLVLDIEGMEANNIINSLSSRVLSSDPYIQQIRVAKFKPDVLRVVIDLKSPINPNVFTLLPAGQYAHRLVVDIYPKNNKAIVLDKYLSSLQSANNTEDATSAVNQDKPIVEPLPTDKVETKNTADKEIKPSDEAKAKPQTETKKQAKKSGRELVIAIDAGHGGEDPGALGANGSHEKEITLAIAKMLKAKVDSQPNMRAVLIRDGDYFVPLGDRVKKARKNKADLFISIHADSFTNSSARGSSVFALSQRGATSASARYLAKKENESDLIGGVSLNYQDIDLAKTLLDLSQTATINDGIKLGKKVLSKIGKINTLHSRDVEQAAFAVLKSPDIPSILVETAFISNPEEESRLNDDSYRDKLTDSILAGIHDYLSTNPSLVSQAD